MSFREQAPAFGAASAKTSDPPDHKAIAADLLSAANEGARGLKGLFFWYVSALAFAVISVAGVTDDQLLRGSPLKLPIIGVDIPLVGYFVFLPFIVVAVHLELLTQFSLLSNKVNDFAASLRALEAEGKKDVAADFRLRLENFLLLHFLAGDHRAVMRCILLLILLLLLAMLPLLTLMLIQVQFSSFGGRAIELWHLALIVTDGAFLLYFWPSFFEVTDLSLRSLAAILWKDVLPRTIFAFIGVVLIYMIGAMLGMGLYAILWLIAGLAVVLVATRSRRQELDANAAGSSYVVGARIRDLAGRLAGRFLKLEPSLAPPRDQPKKRPGLVLVAVTVVFTGLVFQYFLGSFGHFNWTVPLREICKEHGAKMPTSFTFLLGPVVREIVPELNAPPVDDEFDDRENDCAAKLELQLPAGHELGVETQDETRVGKAIDLVLLAFDQSRVLNAPGAFLVKNEYKSEFAASLRGGNAEAIADVEPLDLSDRNLDDAILDDSVLHKVRLEGGYLRRAHLKDAHLIEARMSRAQMQGAIAINARLMGAELVAAQFDGANLTEAKFTGANLSGARFDTATLTKAQFQNATLKDTKFHAALLAQADFVDAVLSDTDFLLSDLSKANFSGTTLLRPSFDGSTLLNSEFNETSLVGGSFRGAFLNQTNFRGASLSSSKSIRADRVAFAGTLIIESDFRGADFSAADLRLAVIVDPIVGPLPEVQSEVSAGDADSEQQQSAPTETAGPGTLRPASTDTRWPEEPTDCLLILGAEPETAGKMPKCNFKVDDQAEDDSVFSLASDAFWEGFLAANVEALCVNAAKLPPFVDQKIDMLNNVAESLIEGRPEGGQVVNRGFGSAMPDCNTTWLIERLKSRRDEETAGNSRSAHNHSRSLVYDIWLKQRDFFAAAY